MLILLLVATAFIYKICSSYFTVFDGGFSNKNEVWGQFGDYIGGTLNPLLSFLSLVTLVFAVIIQAGQLELVKEELSKTLENLEKSKIATQLTTLATAVTAIDASITQLLKDNPHTNSPIGIEKLRNNKRKLHAQINNIVENMSN